MKLTHRLVATGVGLTLATGALVGCSSSSGSSSTAASASGASGAASSGAAAGAGGGTNIFSDTKVQQCLTAAGISIPTGGGTRPSGAMPSGGTRPSGAMPSGGAGGAGGGTPPSGAMPSGGSGGFGGGGNSAEMEKIQAALKACGITLPTGGGGAGAAAASSSAAS